MPTAHCMATPDGVILAVDRGFVDLVGRPEAALVGASYRDITHPVDLDRSTRLLVELGNRPMPLRFEQRYLRPDGSAVPANLFISRFNDPDRLVATLFWQETGRDASLRRLWQAALRIRHVQDVRRAQFGADLAGDAVGAVLVAVYLAEAEGRAIGLDALAAATDLAPATALRWVRALCQRGILLAGNDAPADVRFTPAGMARMERTLSAVYDLPDATVPAA